MEILDAFEAAVRHDPRSCGIPHPDTALNGVWIHESPPLARLPQVALLYTIDDETGRVVLHNLKITRERNTPGR